jgi:hypothetical protein
MQPTEENFTYLQRLLLQTLDKDNTRRRAGNAQESLAQIPISCDIRSVYMHLLYFLAALRQALRHLQVCAQSRMRTACAAP